MASFATRWIRAAPRPIRGSAAGAAPARTPRATTGSARCFREATPVRDGSLRCPHINVMLLAIGLTRRLVTTIFFADEPAGVSDPVLNCVPEADRARLFAVRSPSLDADGLTGYRFDLILRGESETPFFLD